MSDGVNVRIEALADEPASRHFDVSIAFAPLSKKLSWGRAALSEVWETVAPYESVFVGPSVPKHEGDVVITWRETGKPLQSYPMTYDTEAASFKAHVEEQLQSMTVAEFRQVHDPELWAREAAEEHADEALHDAAEAHYREESAVVWAEYYAHKKNEH